MAPVPPIQIDDMEEATEASPFQFLLSCWLTLAFISVFAFTVQLCGCCRRKTKKEEAQEEPKQDAKQPTPAPDKPQTEGSTSKAESVTSPKSPNLKSAKNGKVPSASKRDDDDDSSIIVAKEEISMAIAAPQPDLDDMDTGLSTHFSLRTRDVSVRSMVEKRKGLKSPVAKKAAQRN